MTRRISWPARGSGKEYLARLLAEKMLDDGETVVFARPSGWTKVRRYRRNGRTMDSVTPIPEPKHGHSAILMEGDDVSGRNDE